MGREYTEFSSWTAMPAARRCRVVGSVAREIAENADRLVRLCRTDQRTDDVETITAELLPLCAALRFLRRSGPGLLRPRRLGIAGRPAWLWGVRQTVERIPLGSLLVLGPWNYPVLLPGVQAAQGLAAGNRVLLKPSPGTEAVTRSLVDCFRRAGVPRSALVQLDSDPRAAADAIDAGVDLVVLTGSAATGRQVLARAASALTPAIMELSGCDAMIALESADPDRVAAAIAFGLCLNGGATCIGPRRLIGPSAIVTQVLERLSPRLADLPEQTVHPAARGSAATTIAEALRSGATPVARPCDIRRLRDSGRMFPLVLDGVSPASPIASEDLFAPVLSVFRVGSVEQSIQLVNGCRYRLAASVFGRSADARRIASRLSVGSVTINDLVVPTADPRVPFGGRGESGFGVTRGGEGLLAMTAIRVTAERRGSLLPHLSARRGSDAERLLGFLQCGHGSLSRRLAGLRRLIGRGETPGLGADTSYGSESIS